VAFESTLDAALADERGGRHEGALSFVGTGSVRARHAQGPLVETGRPTDVAIQGPGFFVVAAGDDRRYTRAGSFGVSARGELTGPGGHPVLGSGGPIRVGPSGARIQPDGRVVGGDGALLGRLLLEDFAEPERLVREGDALFRAPPEIVGEPVDSARLVPGSLEQSNVRPVAELAQLMILQRAYEASLQTLEAEDAASQRLIEEVSS